jgi:hypothetical protein
MADHNGLTAHEKVAHPLLIMQWQAANFLHYVPAGVTYEDFVRALKGCCRDHQLVADYWPQLKARTQMSGESLQQFAAAVDQVAHQALVGLPENFIQREADYAFTDR